MQLSKVEGFQRPLGFIWVAITSGSLTPTRTPSFQAPPPSSCSSKGLSPFVDKQGNKVPPTPSMKRSESPMESPLAQHVSEDGAEA